MENPSGFSISLMVPLLQPRGQGGGNYSLPGSSQLPFLTARVPEETGALQSCRCPRGQSPCREVCRPGPWSRLRARALLTSCHLPALCPIKCRGQGTASGHSRGPRSSQGSSSWPPPLDLAPGQTPLGGEVGDGRSERARGTPWKSPRWSVR